MEKIIFENRGTERPLGGPMNLKSPNYLWLAPYDWIRWSCNDINGLAYEKCTESAG